MDFPKYRMNQSHVEVWVVRMNEKLCVKDRLKGIFHFERTVGGGELRSVIIKENFTYEEMLYELAVLEYQAFGHTIHGRTS